MHKPLLLFDLFCWRAQRLSTCFFCSYCPKLEKTKQESKSKDEALRKLEENYQSVQGKAKSKDQLCRNQQEKFSELESQLESKTELCKQLEKQLLQLSNEVKGRDEVCSTLQQKVPSHTHLILFA